MATVFSILLGFLFVLGVVGVIADIRRRKAFSALAARRQWELTKNDRQLPETFGGPPFGVGHRRIAKMVARGRHNGRAILVFDYEYRTPGSDGDDTHHAWVACVDDLPADLPALEVIARTARAELTARPGGQPALPEFVRGDPAFDRRYRVHTASRRLAEDLLDPQVLRLIASWPDFSWRIEGRRLLTWGSGPLAPHWIETNLNMLAALTEAVPDEVWRKPRA